MSVRREVEIEATPEEVWESLATDEGRERWLEDDPDREIHVEVVDAPSRLVWWWWRGDEPATRVEVLVVASPAGARRGPGDGRLVGPRPSVQRDLSAPDPVARVRRRCAVHGRPLRQEGLRPRARKRLDT